MIYHELFGKHLRLGNFLFQVAATIKLCEVHGCTTIYPDYYLWQYLKYPPEISNIGSEPHDKLPSNVEFIASRKWEWTPEEEDWLNSFDFKNKDYQLALNFFFQSYKWFEGYEEEIKKALTPKLHTLTGIMTKHKECFSDKPTIGLGIRLGDFKNHGDFYQIPPMWYIKALDNNFPNWKENYLVVVFSDDIPEAKQIFKDYPFYYTDFNDTASHREHFKYYHGDAHEQFFLGTLMDNFICGNSTFTWWQSWLATYGRLYKDKAGKVVHCGEVFNKRGNMKHCDTTYYYPPTWIKEPIL